MSIKEKIKGTAMSVARKADANSPAILTFFGIGIGIVAFVSAIAVTKKEANSGLVEIQEESEKMKENKEAVGTVNEDGTVYGTKDLIVDDVKSVGKIIGKTAVMYAAPILCEVASVAAITCGYNKLNARYISAAVSAASLKAAYDKAREEIRERYGDEAVGEIFLGVKKKTIEEPVLDQNGEVKTDKNGVVKTKKMSAYIIDNDKDGEYSPYAFVWGAYNEDGTENMAWSNCSMEKNLSEVDILQRMLNSQLQASFKGYVLYNDLRDNLDVPFSSMMNAGWYLDPKNENSDGHVDLRARIVSISYDEGSTYDDAILIDPNVDGDISEYFARNANYSRLH